MKVKFFTALSFVFLIPFFVHASFDPTAWLRSIKITTYTKPKPAVVATSSTSTVGALLDGIANKLSSEREKLLGDQISQLKSENDSLRKSISVLQQKVSTLNTQYAIDINSCKQNTEKIEAAYSPENIAKLRSLEFNIAGDIANNFRNKIDETGYDTGEKTLNIQFFRDGQTGRDFMNELKNYDSMVGTHLVSSAQKFLTAPGNGVAEFQDFFIYFQSVKKFK